MKDSIIKEIKRTIAMTESMYFQTQNLMAAVLDEERAAVLGEEQDGENNNVEECDELYYYLRNIRDEMEIHNDKLNEIYLKIINK